MALKIYGISGSRALRALWGAEEAGVEYEQVPTNFRDDSKTPEYLGVNPNGRIPALVDGDLKLFESMAINLYLAKNYASELYPSDPADEARAIQWSVWAISEIEPLQMQVVIQKLFTKEPRQSIIDGATAGLERPLKVLDSALADTPYLLGDAFTVADLNVAAVMHLMGMVQLTYEQHANVQRWADACYARPALARALAKD